MFVLGGSLKRRERLSARLGDILSNLYLASCALKRYEDDGRPAEDLPFLHWAMQDALVADRGRVLRPLREPAQPLRRVAAARDDLSVRPVRAGIPAAARPARVAQVVSLLLAPGPARERLTRGVFMPKDENEPIAVLEAALRAVIAAEPVGAKIRAARDKGRIAGRYRRRDRRGGAARKA